MNIKSPFVLKQIIEHRQLFTELVAYIEEHDGDVEIPSRLYRSIVRQAIKAEAAQGNHRECERIRYTLAEENLLRERLIIRIDPARGTLVLAPFVVDMLRHFDVGRMRGLSQAELEGLRDGLNQSLAAFQEQPIDLENDNFTDELRLLRRRIQDTLGKMQESVAALEAQGDHLADLVEQQDVGSLEGSAETRRALEHINRIYQRYILPALEFLDPKTRFKQGIPAITAIRRIAKLAAESDHPALNEELQFSANAIQSYVKDIDALRLSLERYVRQDRQQRQQYDAIERAFNAIRLATEERHDDSLRNLYIPVRHPAIQSPGTFEGIKRVRFTRLEWHDIDHRADIEEFTDRRIAELRAQLDHAGTITVDPTRAGLSEAELREQLRQHEIQALLEAWTIPGDCQDLHASLHDYLSSHLAGYALNDLLEALDWVMALPDFQFHARFLHHEIAHGELALSYHPLIPREALAKEITA